MLYILSQFSSVQSTAEILPLLKNNQYSHQLKPKCLTGNFLRGHKNGDVKERESQKAVSPLHPKETMNLKWMISNLRLWCFLNPMEIRWVHNRMENCPYDRIPFNFLIDYNNICLSV